MRVVYVLNYIINNFPRVLQNSSAGVRKQGILRGLLCRLLYVRSCGIPIFLLRSFQIRRLSRHFSEAHGNALRDVFRFRRPCGISRRERGILLLPLFLQIPNTYRSIHNFLRRQRRRGFLPYCRYH